MQDLTKKAFPIRNDDDLQRALTLVQALWDSEPGSEDSELLEVMGVLVEEYESRQPGLPPGDPIETIRFKLDELGWSQNRLAQETGLTSGRISELMTRKRPLTLDHVRRISVAMGLPSGLLTHDTRTVEDGTVWIALPQEVAARARDLASSRSVGVAELLTSLVKEAAFRSKIRSVKATYISQSAASSNPAPNLNVYRGNQPYERRNQGVA